MQMKSLQSQHTYQLGAASGCQNANFCLVQLGSPKPTNRQLVYAADTKIKHDKTLYCGK